MRQEQIFRGLVTAQNSPLCWAQQRCERERGDNYLHRGLCFLSACCAFGTVSDGNICSFSGSSNGAVPRKSPASSRGARGRRRRLQRDPSNARRAWEVVRSVGTEVWALAPTELPRSTRVCLYSKRRSYPSEQHPSSLLMFLKCNSHLTTH